MAIGSPRAGTMRIVTLDVFLMIALGSWGASRLDSARRVMSGRFFYQVKATDADMIALTGCAILFAALMATLPAVLRELRTDPIEILLAE
jgi:hypothetical protein